MNRNRIQTKEELGKELMQMIREHPEIFDDLKAIAEDLLAKQQSE